MRNAKIIISNDFRIVDDYVDDGIDGILLKDMSAALRAAIRKIEANEAEFDPICKAAQDRFQQHYSQGAIERTMSDLIEGRQIGESYDGRREKTRPAA